MQAETVLLCVFLIGSSACPTESDDLTVAEFLKGNHKENLNNVDLLQSVQEEEENATESEDSQKEQTKTKRETACEEIMRRMKSYPCEEPIVLSCGPVNAPMTIYPCGTSREAEEQRMLDAEEEANEDPIIGFNPEPTTNTHVVIPHPVPAPPTQDELLRKQKGIFEGLLRFATIFNQVDTYITDKGKTLIKGLNRMVNSAEDRSRF